MSQYQAYQKPTYGGAPPPPSSSYPFAPDHYNQSPPPPPASEKPNSVPTPPPSYPSPQHDMSHQPMQQPAMAYQQGPLAEKAEAVAHVHQVQGSKFGTNWSFGLFDCCAPLSTCCLGTWCPCVLFGRTYAREHGEGETNGLGGMCCLWYLAASFGFNSCLQCVFRGQQRERYGINSSTFNDFCASCCCACCTLIQEEKESIVRVTGMDPKTKVAYQPLDQKMTYPA